MIGLELFSRVARFDGVKKELDKLRALAFLFRAARRRVEPSSADRDSPLAAGEVPASWRQSSITKDLDLPGELAGLKCR